MVDNERGTHHAGGPHIHGLSVWFPDHHLQECFETFGKFQQLFGDGNDNSDILFTTVKNCFVQSFVPQPWSEAGGVITIAIIITNIIVFLVTIIIIILLRLTSGLMK